ncbi:MAG: glycosyltransferase family 4 protein [Thaumarchaeota archaeon]|nr:glycosyltransferase family 4 protein [Nitrososphaerota archaeon]
MKVAQVCPFFFPVDGGVENHVLNISKELVKRGHDVDVYTSATTRDSSPLESFASVVGLDVYRSKVLGRIGEFGSFWPGFAPLILKRGYDLVHAHSYRHPHTDLSPLIAKLSRAGSVLTSHSPFYPSESRSSLARGLVPAYDGLVAPFTLRAYGRVISLTKAEANLLIRLGAPSSRISIIPNGVEDVHFQHVDSSEFTAKFELEGKRAILYLGRINRTKGLDVLLRAFAMVSVTLPDTRLVIAGPATSPKELAYRDFLTGLVRSLRLSSCVTFTGRLSEQDKLAALDCCTAFVLPSIYEGQGLVLLEAAAHGKPIVSTRTDGPRSLIEENVNGLLVEPGDEAGLTEALLSLLNDTTLAERLAREARVTALGYRWRNVVDRIESVYSGVGSAS